MFSLYWDGSPVGAKVKPPIGIISDASDAGGLPVPDIDSMVLDIEGESG